jgi:RHS repeat-associated protein
VGNTTTPWHGTLQVYVGKAGAGPGGTDLISILGRLASIPTSSQAFSYDTDGNLSDDGVWTYTWEGENRLVQMQTTSAAVSAGFQNLQLTFAYDYLGRRIQKRVVNLTSSTELSSRRYLYDGWNLVEEFNAPGGTSLGSVVRTYTWGLDIARSLTDAGGVGALVQVADYASGNSYFATYDGNGNVASLVNGSSGAIAAAYEYDPYGVPLRTQVLDAVVGGQPFRFSTKFTDGETGLLYYGYRYYSVTLGRFINRDPIEEAGGLNLYGFVLNQWRPIAGPATV